MANPTRKGFRESNLALVKGDRRRVFINLPLSLVTRYREEARAAGVTLDEYIVSLLNQPKPRRATKKKPAKR